VVKRVLVRILDRFEQAEAVRLADAEAWHNGECDRDRFMVERKKDREIWSLGHFVDAYNVSASRKLVWVGIRDAPDFALFDQKQDLVSHLEATEWLDGYPDRKRDEEYKGPPITVARHIDEDSLRAERSISHLREQLTEKFRKARIYPENTWLLKFFYGRNAQSILFEGSSLNPAS
jgi:hypothetical protein